MISGHLAIAILLRRHGQTDPGLTLLGSYFPDLWDKSLHHTFGLTRSGRYMAHTLFACGLTTALVTVVAGRSAGRTWGSAYLGHLLADSLGRVPWLFPFKQYRFRRSRSLWLRLKSGALLRPRPTESLLWLLVIGGSTRSRGDG